MCVTRVGEVRASDGEVAVVTVDGRDRDVPLVVLGDEAAAVLPGDWLLLHTGLAVRRLDAREAAELRAALDEIEGSAP
jgi:hydrogenase expression/formation protein HypC